MTKERMNHLLGALSHESHELLLSKSEVVSLPRDTIFYEPGETPSFGWFLTSGLATTVAFTTGDKATAVGRMGNEGVVGSVHLLGPTRIPTRCFMQVEGTAVRIPFLDLQQAFWSSTEIRARVLELIQEQVACLLQSAACHLHHEAKERLASLLLTFQDRAQVEVLDISHEVLAKMLGTRRSTVSLIAAEFQSRGLIAYSRGQLRILDRVGLETAACDCFPITQQLHRSLYRATTGPGKLA